MNKALIVLAITSPTITTVLSMLLSVKIRLSREPKTEKPKLYSKLKLCGMRMKHLRPCDMRISKSQQLGCKDCEVR